MTLVTGRAARVAWKLPAHIIKCGATMLDDAVAELPFDDNDYPRTYKLSFRWVLQIWMRAVLWPVFGLFGLFVLPHIPHLASWEASSLAIFCFALVGVGIYTVCGSLRYTVVLLTDSIDVSGGVSARRMRRDEIRGRRRIVSSKFPAIELVPKDESAKSLNVQLRLDTDLAFDRWFATLPDLDAQDLAESQQQLLKARHLDPATEEGARTIKRLRQLALAINFVSAGLLFECWMWPATPSLVITLLLLPWLAIGIVARYQPLYRFNTNRGDRHLSLTIPLVAPGILLSYSTLSPIHTLDWSPVLTVTCVVSVLLTAAAAAVDPWLRKRGKDVFCLLLVTAFYGYGGGLDLNALADSGNPQVYPTTVLSKSVSHGRRGTTTWYLRLAAWGPVPHAGEVSVSRVQALASSKGSTVCVYLYPGALGIRWYQIGQCGAP